MIREETRKKIYEFQAPPPPAAWEQIRSALDAEASAPVRKIPLWVKYAASVLVIATVVSVWHQFSLNGNSPVENRIAASSAEPEPGGVTMAPDPRDAKPLASAAQDNTQKTVASSTVPGGRNKSNAARSVQPIYLSQAVYPNTVPVDHERSGTLERILRSEEETDILNENYIYLTSGNGQSIRVSRKLASAILSEMGLSEEGLNTYETRLLAQKISAWKSMLAESSFVPSPSNMMDLLALMEMLEEN